MANTSGFEALIQLQEAVLRKFLRAAWKSAECPTIPGEEGRIDEFFAIEESDGIGFGGYQVVDGQVQIPQDELDAQMWPAVNGTELKFGLHIQVEIGNPPVPSAGLFDMTVDVRARVPIDTLSGGNNVGLILAGLPRSDVLVDLTSGDPLKPQLLTLMKEYLHKAYENWTPTGPLDPAFPEIPHVFERTGVVWPVLLGQITVDAYGEIFDDQGDPAKRIEVTLLPDANNPTEIEISLPIYLRVFNYVKTGSAQYIPLLDPMGVETRLKINAPFSAPAGSYTAELSSATASTDPLMPAAGIEGDNYTSNKGLPVIGDLLDANLSTAIVEEGESLAHAMGDQTIDVPTVAEIEQAIGDLFHQRLEDRQYIQIWTPEDNSDDFAVDRVDVKALSDSLVIALNAGGSADINAVTNLIPAGREFAVALDGAKVDEIIEATREDNGFDDASLPKDMDVDGEEATLNELDVALTDGSLRMTGEVTVIDAVLGSIDVDADFTVNIGFRWEPDGDLDSNDMQMMEHEMLGDPDVDPEMSVLFWVIAVILAIISFGAAGLIGVLIVVIVVVIVRAIAANIGSSMIVNPVDDTLEGITAWPPELSKIGRVRAVFFDPIEIETSGLLLAGMIDVISECESTEVIGADSGGQYSVAAASPLNLTAAATHGDASYKWLAGDGSPVVNTQNKSHTYAASALYIAKHTLTMNQFGGATSRHFALVDVKNVPPTADAGPDITVLEGEVVTLVGRFSDVEYPDTHETSWNFGDHQSPEAGLIEETNTPPQAFGTSTVQHAWCDNGEYVVTFRVRDQNGGMATDTRKVTVLNRPPDVRAGNDMYAYPCSVLTLQGKFVDPGWCDTHTGTWSFGDCSPTKTAIIRETNDPPAAIGDVIASHTYQRCGTYHVECTVTDDDGATGRDSIVVRVIDVMNAGFEDGFRGRRLGEVANHWHPYATHRETFPPATSSSPKIPELRNVYACERCCVHGGQRSQRIRLEHPIRAGIYQQVGANPKWDYQICAWYSLHEALQGAARLGIDPAGGTDPDAAGIVWTAGATRLDWEQLTERVTAVQDKITIFLELLVDERQRGDVCFDDVVLVPIQPFCPDEPEEPDKPERPDKPDEPDRRVVCVNFKDLQTGQVMPPTFEKSAFAFMALEGGTRKILNFGPPPGENKLELRASLRVDLPISSDLVHVWLACLDRHEVFLLAEDGDGNVVSTVTTPLGSMTSLYTAVLTAPGMMRLQLTTKSKEAILYQICVQHDGGARPVADASNLSEVRAVLAANKANILKSYQAVGVGIGKEQPTDSDHVIVVYLESEEKRPHEKPCVEGISLKFEVTGRFRPLRP